MKVKKIDKRKAQGAETKKKLYEVAERLYQERNVSEVSIEDITNEVGITKGGFYVHFESKDALIALLIADHVAKADMDYKAFVEALPADMPAASMLLALSEKIVDTLLNTIGWENMKKVYQILLGGTVDTQALKGYGRELYMLFYSILEKGIQRKEITSSLPLEVLSRHFVMAIRGISYEWCVRYPDFDLKAQTAEHIQLLLKGICLPTSKND
ncbi:MAG: TetR/AcrR family transcriptional regulator [Epulopiscium sp.]|jgi:AcrR family transcriptional regulator|nr:TetR/AcrR family transcriptional regulator [Candidatus Epulonipiscium sp.]